MSIESDADWKGLRRAAEVARQTLDLLSHHVRAGVTTGDLWTLGTRDGSLAAHVEHTLVITRGAPIVLTAA